MTYLLDLEKMSVYIIDDDLEDENGNTIYNINNREVPNEIVEGLANLADNVISAYPLEHGEDVDTPESVHHTRPSAGTLLEDDDDTFNVLEEDIDHGEIDQTTVSSGDHHTRPTAGTLLEDDADTFNVLEEDIDHTAIDQTTVSAGDHHGASDHEKDGDLEILIENLAQSAVGTDQVLVGDGDGGVQTAEYVETEDIREVTEQTADYTASLGDVVLVDADGEDITITLPTPSTNRFVDVKKTDSSGNTVTVETSDSETIDGDTSKTIDTQYENLSMVSDGTDWHIV